jgi:hypothetical protein
MRKKVPTKSTIFLLEIMAKTVAAEGIKLRDQNRELHHYIRASPRD